MTSQSGDGRITRVARAEHLELPGGFVALARATEARITKGGAGVVVASGQAAITQGGWGPWSPVATWR